MKEQLKNYKFSWGVDQRAILESGLKIDIIDFSILRMLMDFSTSGSCQQMECEGRTFFMFRWSLVKQQLPILNLNTRQSVKRRIDKLVEAKLIAPHPGNQQNRASWFRFAENRAVLFQNGAQKVAETVNKKLHNSTKTSKNSQQIVTQTVTNGLHSVNNGSPNSQHSFTHSVTNGLHYNTNNNNTNNNTYIASEIEGIKTNLPPSWPDSVKLSVAQYLEYRQDLPGGGHIKTQKGWNAKIKRFTKIIADYDETTLMKAIELSIEKEWKDVKIEWLFKEFPELRTKNLVNTSAQVSMQKEAKEKLTALYKAYRDKWKTKYTNQAKTDYIKALNLFYFDNPSLKPSSNATSA